VERKRSNNPILPFCSRLANVFDVISLHKRDLWGYLVTDTEKKPVGRPRKYAGRRPTWTIRLEAKYGDQIKKIAEDTGRSISEVCEQQIGNAFRADIMIDVLEKEIATLTKDLEGSRIASKVAIGRMEAAEQQVDDLKKQLDQERERIDAIETTNTATLKRLVDSMTPRDRPLFLSDVEKIVEMTIERMRKNS
jgi:hypothetical protein